jgi:hypothetical protein
LQSLKVDFGLPEIIIAAYLKLAVSYKEKKIIRRREWEEKRKVLLGR